MQKELESLKEKRPCVQQWAHTFELSSRSLSPAQCNAVLGEMKALQEVCADIRSDIPPGIPGGSTLSLALAWLKNQSEEAVTHLVSFEEGGMSPDEKDLLTLNLHEIALAIEQITSFVEFHQLPTGHRGKNDVHAPVLQKELETLSEKMPCVVQWVCMFGLSSRPLSLDQWKEAMSVLEDLQRIFTTIGPAIEKHPIRATALREAIHQITNALTQLVSYQAVCESPKRENLYQRRLITIYLDELVLAIQKILKSGAEQASKTSLSTARKRQRTHLSVVPNTGGVKQV